MTKVSKNNPVLSVIVLNYNAGNYIQNCIDSIFKSELSDNIELIIVDSASTDDSIAKLKSTVFHHPHIIDTRYLLLTENKGFSYGNNCGVKIINRNSEYILFLNPDTTVDNNTLQGIINFLKTHPDAGAATCNVVLALTGKTQPESHRGFPTPINTFWHFFGFGLPKLFPRSKFFNGYFMGHLDYTQPQIIDSCVGAFMMVKKNVGDICGWWNEKYFMYGEDIDFAYQIKKNHFNLYFVPQFKIIHYQGISSGIKKTKSAATRQTKIRSALATTKAMRIFYHDNLINNYPKIIQYLVWKGIDFLEFYRIFKAKYL